MIRDIVSCQGSSISSAIVCKIFHHILKREGVFYVVVLIDELQSFIAEEITIGLLGIKSMCHGKLVDDSNYVTFFSIKSTILCQLTNIANFLLT